MKSFYDFLNIINEAPAPPPGGPPPSAAATPSPAASAAPPAPAGIGGGLGGGLGGPPPSLGMGGSPAMPDLGGPGGPGMQGEPNQNAPIKPNVIKPVSVWSALQKIIDSKSGQPKQKKL